MHDLGIEPKPVFRSSLEDGFDMPDLDAKWPTLSKEWKTRKNRWITRYASNISRDPHIESSLFQFYHFYVVDRLSEGMIKTPHMSLIEERWHRIQASGWENVIVPKMQLPKLEDRSTVKDLVSNKDSYFSTRSWMCWECWGVVSTGENRVQCSSCSLVAHRYPLH